MIWEELTSEEKTALRHLAKGEVQEVPWRQIRRLRELGLADDNPEGRLTPAGLELWRTRPTQTGRWRRARGEAAGSRRRRRGGLKHERGGGVDYHRARPQLGVEPHWRAARNLRALEGLSGILCAGP